MVKERIFVTDFECLSVPTPYLHPSPTHHLPRPYSKASSISKKPFLLGALIGTLEMSMRLRMVLFIPFNHPQALYSKNTPLPPRGLTQDPTHSRCSKNVCSLMKPSSLNHKCSNVLEVAFKPPSPGTCG